MIEHLRTLMKTLQINDPYFFVFFFLSKINKDIMGSNNENYLFMRSGFSTSEDIGLSEQELEQVPGILCAFIEAASRSAVQYAVHQRCECKDAHVIMALKRELMFAEDIDSNRVDLLQKALTTVSEEEGDVILNAMETLPIIEPKELDFDYSCALCRCTFCEEVRQFSGDMWDLWEPVTVHQRIARGAIESTSIKFGL